MLVSAERGRAIAPLFVLVAASCAHPGEEGDRAAPLDAAESTLQFASFEAAADRPAPDWLGNSQYVIARETCEGRACDRDRRSLDEGFVYGTYARQRAVIRSLYFDVWEPGVTDRDNPDLWRQLDVRVHYRFGADWQWRWVPFERRVGNDARYEVRLRELDPQGELTRRSREECPDVPLVLAPDGVYVRTPIEVYFTVNGVALRAADGGPFRGTYEQYASLFAPCPIQ